MSLTMSSASAPNSPRKRKKWSLSAMCIGEVPDEQLARFQTPINRVLETKPYSAAPTPNCLSPATSPVTSPVRLRTIRFQDPLPVPRALDTPHKNILTRIAFYCDSQSLRKLRSVSRDMRAIAEAILLRHVVVMRGGVRILPPPGGTRCWVSFVDDTPLPLEAPKPKPKESAPAAIKARAEADAANGSAEPHSFWRPSRPSEEEEDEDAPWPESDTDAESDDDDESVASNEPSSFSSTVAAACNGLHLPPTTKVTFILPSRSRLLRKARVVDIHPEADAPTLRRMLSAPPPITRTYPGASGTLKSSTVIVFSRPVDGVPPAYPRPALTTSAAQTVVTHLLDAEGSEALEGLSCGTERTVVLISPGAPHGHRKEDLMDDDEAEVATLVDRQRTLNPPSNLSPTTSPDGALARRHSLIDDNDDPHRLLESLAGHIARLLPKSGSSWTIVGAENWPCEWAASGSERKCGPDEMRDMEGALRALVASKFADWADKDSGDRLRFLTRAEWAVEVGAELYMLSSEL